MRLSISNIAWPVANDLQVAAQLQQFSIDAIDVAPGKYFPAPTDATDKDISQVRQWWEARGIEIVGMQALLFGTSGLNIFGSAESQLSMLKHLSAVCRIGAGLGATKLVFGSPKNRDRQGRSDQECLDIAIPFFRKLGDIAQSAGVDICLEPNPSVYGSNYMTTSTETAQVVLEVAHPSIGMQFDSGALTLNSEVPIEILKDHSTLIRHIHISEPGLVTLGDCDTDHAQIAQALKQYVPNLIATVEMLATDKEPPMAAIQRALETAIHYYRAPHGEAQS